MSNNSLSAKDLELFKKLKRRNGIILTIFSLIYIVIATAVAMLIGNTKTVKVSEPHEFYSNYEKFDDISEDVNVAVLEENKNESFEIYITTDYLNNRVAPKGEIIKVLKPYTVIDVLSIEDDWVKLTDGTYVYIDYVTKIVRGK